MGDINEAIESLRLSITSGNRVPVTRATVKADDLRALLADHARLRGIDLEQFREAVEFAWDHGSAARRPERDRLLSLIDGQANVRSSSEHSSEVAADLVTDDAVRRLVRAMEDTPGDELIEPNTRLCRRLLAAALQPTKGEGE